MLPIEEVKKWLIENRTDKNGDLNLAGLDLSDFEGRVLICCWKVKKSLDQSWQKVGGSLNQSHQEVEGNLYQDEQKTKDECECVAPDYKAEYEKLQKELCEANRQKEALLWALEKAMGQENEILLYGQNTQGGGNFEAR